MIGRRTDLWNPVKLKQLCNSHSYPEEGRQAPTKKKCL